MCFCFICQVLVSPAESALRVTRVSQASPDHKVSFCSKYLTTNTVVATGLLMGPEYGENENKN